MANAKGMTKATASKKGRLLPKRLLILSDHFPTKRLNTASAMIVTAEIVPAMEGVSPTIPVRKTIWNDAMN